MFKRFIFLSICLMLVSCNLFAQDGDFKLLWDYNTEPDMSHYNVFLLSAPDTTQSPFVQNGNADEIREWFVISVNHNELQALDPDTARYIFSSALDGNYLQAALTAVDTTGLESLVAVSGFYKKEDATRPQLTRIIYVGRN